MELQKRKNLRLENFDYNMPYLYFITICTANKISLFSGIVGAILSQSIGFLKANVSKNIHRTDPSLKIWQLGYYDHIIRNEEDYKKHWQYIEDNPVMWAIGKEFI